MPEPNSNELDYLDLAIRILPNLPDYERHNEAKYLMNFIAERLGPIQPMSAPTLSPAPSSRDLKPNPKVEPASLKIPASWTDPVQKTPGTALPIQSQIVQAAEGPKPTSVSWVDSARGGQAAEAAKDQDQPNVKGATYDPDRYRYLGETPNPWRLQTP